MIKELYDTTIKGMHVHSCNTYVNLFMLMAAAQNSINHLEKSVALRKSPEILVHNIAIIEKICP